MTQLLILGRINNLQAKATWYISHFYRPPPPALHSSGRCGRWHWTKVTWHETEKNETNTPLSIEYVVGETCNHWTVPCVIWHAQSVMFYMLCDTDRVRVECDVYRKIDAGKIMSKSQPENVTYFISYLRSSNNRSRTK